VAKKETIAVFPGSFDPVTLGHLDLIRRTAPLFSRLIVAVGVNAEKKPYFSPEERVEMIRSSLADYPNTEAALYAGLTVDFARQVGASVLIRGIRNEADFAQEKIIASVNRRLAPKIETLFLPAGAEWSFLSSSLVKGLYGTASEQDLARFLPPASAEAFRKMKAQTVKNR